MIGMEYTGLTNIMFVQKFGDPMIGMSGMTSSLVDLWNLS